MLYLRPVNLIISAATLCISYFLLVVPLQDHLNQNLQLQTFDFWLLTISVICIMCGGNVINDILDLETDEINRRRRNVANFIGKRSATYLYYTLSTVGLSLGLYVSVQLGRVELWIIHLSAFLLLLAYSSFLKSMPVLGNFTVALLCAILPVIPLIFEKGTYSFQFDPHYFLFNFLSLFAFLLTFIRELVKDIQDVKGDEVAGNLTLPILFGTAAAIGIVHVLSALFLILLLTVVVFSYGTDWFSTIYLTCFVLLPMIYVLMQLNREPIGIQLKKTSNALKILMFIGLVYAALFSIISL